MMEKNNAEKREMLANLSIDSIWHDSVLSSVPQIISTSVFGKAPAQQRS